MPSHSSMPLIILLPHNCASWHPFVSSLQSLPHFIVPPEKYWLYSTQLPLNRPRLLPSHSSPGSINLLPHFCAAVQPFVSSWQLLQASAPPLNPKSKQLSIAPNKLPSHFSFIFITPLPQVPVVPKQLLVSSLHLLHLSVPPVKNEEYCLQSPLNDPMLLPSHSSPVSINSLPHNGFGVHLLVSIKQFDAHVKVPPTNPKSAQLSIAPNKVVSQCSPFCNILSPQNGC